MDDDKRRKNQRKPSQSKIPVLDGAVVDSDTLVTPCGVRRDQPFAFATKKNPVQFNRAGL